MKKEFIEQIYKNNHTAKGREQLYAELSETESQCWQEIESKNILNWTEIFLERATEHPDNIVIIETETQNAFTYRELELASKKIMNHILATTDAYQIGLNYHNSFAFVATLIGINRAGRLAILFNNREPLERIEMLAKNSKTNIVFGNLIKGLEHKSIETILESKESLEPIYKRETKSLDDPAFVIFTSGTSGASKPALFSHRRMVGAGVAWSLRTAMEATDRCYIPLPLYHGNGLAVAFSSIIYTGATAVLRPKFSVSNFWHDINSYQCSHNVYIGELWRYLISKKESTNPNNSLKVIFGNGLNTSL
jgi:fatty-acyl-CoA synthase